jgi:hypothetical protein
MNVRSTLAEIGLCEFQDSMKYLEGFFVSMSSKLPVRALYLMIDETRRKYFFKKKAL